MSYLEYSVKRIPTGAAKVLYLNWALVLLAAAVAGVGFLMLYSVAGGSFEPWAAAQFKRFIVGLSAMFVVALTPIWFWRNNAAIAYALALLLLVFVEFMGAIGMGAQRWIDLGFIRLQPSELMKVVLILFLAAYYDWLTPERTSRPLWVLVPMAFILIPTLLVLRQPDLGTALLLMTGGGAMMFIAGVHWAYFAAAITAVASLLTTVLGSRGTSWQLLKDYQFRRIDTFLDPAADPLGAGYHITQSKIALGSGGLGGRGFMQGTQSRLNFLPEKQTDFIFTTLAEEFGLFGTMGLLVLYALIIVLLFSSAMSNRDRFGALLTHGIAVTFFLFFATNIAMVTGLAPVVGVPLPLVSYGGSAMLVLLFAFGLAQSAHVHRAR